MTGTGTGMGRSPLMWLLITVSVIGGSFPFCPAVVEAFRCAPHCFPPVSSTRVTPRASRMTTAGASTRTATVKLPLAFFLPDEDRQIRQEDDEPGTKEESGAGVLDSLMDKIDKNRTDDENTAAAPPPQKKDNNSMAFLKRMGRVGGAANKNFVNSVGSDEGSTGRQPPASRGDGPGGKARAAFRECTASGVVDDLSEPFPATSSGSAWRGVTDRVAVPGGASNGSLRREADLRGRAANVLAGRVRAPRAPPGAGDGGGTREGFLQMVTDLPLDPARAAVDAAGYDGLELDVLYRPPAAGADGAPAPAADGGNVFRLHVRAPGTLREASYRHTFALDRADAWETVRVPFSGFRRDAAAAGDAAGGDRTLDPKAIKRIGVVALGRDMDVFVAVGGLRFYSVF